MTVDKTADMEHVYENLTEINGVPITDNIMTPDNYTDFMVLGPYKSIHLEKEPLPEITKEDVDAEIANNLAAYPIETTDPSIAVKQGDTVHLSYTCIIDGTTVKDAAEQNLSIEIGSGTFFEDFEEQLIGMHIGTPNLILVTFPEDYATTDFAGKDVLFNVTITSIYGYMEKITEEWLLTYTQYTTEKDYRDSIRQNLYDTYASSAESLLKYKALVAVSDSSQFKQYPRIAVEKYIQALLHIYQSRAKQSGMDYLAYL